MSRGLALRAIGFVACVLTACSRAESNATVVSTATLRPVPSATASVTAVAPRQTVQPIPTVGPTPTPLTHIVQLHETLLGIAAQYGLQLEALLGANPGLNPRLLSVGQALIIPGPQGEPVGELLSLPSPEPVHTTQPVCYPQGERSLRCMFLATNPGEAPLEGVVFTATQIDRAGEAVQTITAVPALAILPPEAAVPVAFALPMDPNDVGQVLVQVQSAYPSPDWEARFLPLESRQSVYQPSPDRRRWELQGEVAVPEGPEGSVSVRIVAVALAADGNPLGFATWTGPSAFGQTLPYRLTVFSLGGEIDVVDMQIEALVQATES